MLCIISLDNMLGSKKKDSWHCRKIIESYYIFPAIPALFANL